MIYIAWAGCYEGNSDRAYYDVLLPRVMDEIVLAEARQNVMIATTPVLQLGRHGRDVQKVAEEICSNKDQIHIVFIHADTGGRAQAKSLPDRSSAYCEAIHDRCAWNSNRCVILTPRHETEAWVLADPAAVVAALSYTGTPSSIDLPANGAAAEALPDPKATLEAAAAAVIGPGRRRGGVQLFTAVAQTQTLDALRTCASFRIFENNLRRALISVGCLPRV